MAQELLSQDLAVLEQMVARLGDYLASGDTHWSMRLAGMPKLTIGGCLMRLDRLQILQGELPTDEQDRLVQIQTQFAGIIKESVVHFEQRLHQELHARLGEWVHYLSDLSQHMMADKDYFAGKVDTRVVIAAMINKLQQPPYKLQQQIINELQPLDGNLRSRWQSGRFVWDEVWQKAYDQEQYWYLYGSPR